MSPPPASTQRQDYMGASTVWGPREGEFYTCSLDRLATGADPGLDFSIPARRVPPRQRSASPRSALPSPATVATCPTSS